MERTRLVWSPHPVLSASGREVVTDVFLPGETISEYLARTRPIILRTPVVLFLNDRRLAREEWDHVCPRSGDIITARAVVQGGDGSDPLRIVLAIAVLVFAQWAGPYFFGTEIAFGSVTWGQIGTTLITVAGMAVVSSLVAPTPPMLSNDSLDNPSPTYSLGGGQNRARPYEPLPLLFGRHKVVADYSSRPYTELRGDDQYLYQAFNFGLSDMSLSDFKIGTTLLTSYEGVETQIAGADGRLTILAGNVDALTGWEMRYADGWVQRTTSVNTRRIGVDVAVVAWSVDGEFGNPLPESCIIQVQYRAVGAGSWTNLVYSEASPDGSTGVAFGFPASNAAGLANLDLKGGADAVGYYPNNCINPSSIGTVVALQPGEFAIRSKSRKTWRVGLNWTVPEGQYEIQVRLSYDKQAMDEFFLQAAVTGVKCYQPDTADYTGQKRFALVIRASSQIQGVVQQLSAVGSATCPVWNGSTWVTQATSNPAWWFLWFARGKHDAQGRRLYGAGLPDSRIDIEEIKLWGAFCTSKGLVFDFVLDRKMNCSDVLAIIARAGRATYTWSTGKLGVIWEAEGQPVEAVFGMANIRKGSFQVNYVTEKLPDEIVVNYISEELDWSLDPVRALVPGVTQPVNSLQLDLLGCTSRTVAGKEALRMAASQYYHRRRIFWEADVEGLTISRGSVVSLSHDLTQWGYSGRLPSIPSLVGGVESFSLVGTLTRVVASGYDPYGNLRYTLTDDSTGWEYASSASVAAEQGATYQASVLVKKDTNESRFCLLRVVFTGGVQKNCDVTINSKTGAILGRSSFAACKSEDVEGFWLISVTGVPNADNTHVRGDFYPAICADSLSGTYTPTATGAVEVGGMSLRKVNPLSLGRAVIMGAAGQNYIGIRLVDGTYDIHQVADATGETEVVTISGVAPVLPWDSIDVVWVFEPKATPGRKLRIVGWRPLSPYVVKLEAIDELDAYHQAENGVFSYTPIQPSARPARALNLTALETWVPSAPRVASVRFSWQLEQALAARREVQVDGSSWQDLGVSGSTFLEFSYFFGTTVTLRVTPVPILVGQAITPATLSHTIQAGAQVPPTVSGVAAIVSPYKTRIEWVRLTEVEDIDYYEIRVGTTWENSRLVGKTSDGFIDDWELTSAGVHHVMVKAHDTFGSLSLQPGTVDVTITAPTAPTISATFEGGDLKLSWSGVTSLFAVDYYEIRYGSDWQSGVLQERTYGNLSVFRAQFSGLRKFFIAAVDIAGNVGAAGSVEVTVTPPHAPGVTPVVIDNNVMLRWTDATETLPIDYYEVRRGATWEAGVVLASGSSGRFATIFEEIGDTYDYWVAGYDLAGNQGTPAKATAIVNQPPDFILKQEWADDFSGTKTNVYVENGKLYGPVPPQTFEQHFTQRGGLGGTPAWDQPQDQIDLGYTYYFEPSSNSATYERIFDYTSLIQVSTTISVTLTNTLIRGSVNVTTTIKISSDGVSWDTGVVSSQRMATNFRYVKVILTLTSADNNDLTEISALHVRIALKQRTDSGVKQVLSTDATGTQVDFNLTNPGFIDVDSITLTVLKGAVAEPLIAIYDFVDAANPTGFKVFVFDRLGVRKTATVSWLARGV